MPINSTYNLNLLKFDVNLLIAAILDIKKFRLFVVRKFGMIHV